MARRRKRIEKENVLEEEEIVWSEMDKVSADLEHHIESRVLPFCKFLSSTIHQAHWADRSDTEYCTVDDSAVLVGQLKNLIAKQAESLQQLEEQIAKNRAAMAMRFCT
jgi:hypothetical protein